MENRQRGSVPLALVVLIVIMTTSMALMGYAFNEIKESRNKHNVIYARYAAEAGAEHYIYHVIKQLNQNAAAQPLESLVTMDYRDPTEPVITGPHWSVGGVPLGGQFTYLTLGTNLTSFTGTLDGGWTYSLKKVDVIQNTADEENDPKILLPTVPNFQIDPADQFVLDFAIEAKDSTGRWTRDLEVKTGFPVALHSGDDDGSVTTPAPNVIHITRYWKLRVVRNN